MSIVSNKYDLVPKKYDFKTDLDRANRISVVVASCRVPGLITVVPDSTVLGGSTVRVWWGPVGPGQWGAIVPEPGSLGDQVAASYPESVSSKLSSEKFHLSLGPEWSTPAPGQRYRCYSSLMP